MYPMEVRLWGEQFKEHYSDVLKEPETLADKICDRLRPILARTANSRRNQRSTRRNQGWRCVQSFSSPMRNSGASKGKGRSPNRGKTPAFFGAKCARSRQCPFSD